MIITIDGPTASGKSTVCRMLADQLRFFCLNSGMLYRALGYILINDFGYSVENLQNASYDTINAAINDSSFDYLDGKIILDGNDINEQLKNPAIDLAASLIGQNATARQLLTSLQRKLTKNCDTVAEGRDTGSVVFPDANYKFYLTAVLETRAKRYMDYQRIKGIELTMNEAITIIQNRDERDKSRIISPLIVPVKAIVIDSSLLNLAQTIALIRSYIKL